VSGVLLSIAGRGGPTRKAALYGSVAGVLFGLSASLTKPTLDFLKGGIGEMLSHWEPYVLALVGILGFVLQQISLGTGRLAPSVATVSTVNPFVSILIGTFLLDERLSRPTWHVVVAIVGLVLALGGAVVISMATERAPDGSRSPVSGSATRPTAAPA
jgi:drug/metabolite transporter (DMT)-like permease